MSRLGSKVYVAVTKKKKVSSKKTKAIQRAPRGAVSKTAQRHGVKKATATRYRQAAKQGKLSPPEFRVQRDYCLREAIRHLQGQSRSRHGKRITAAQIIARYVDSYMTEKTRLKGTKVPSHSYVKKFSAAVKKKLDVASLQRAPKAKPKNHESDLTQLSSINEMINSNYQYLKSL